MFQPTAFQNLDHHLAFKIVGGLIMAVTVLYLGAVCYHITSTTGGLGEFESDKNLFSFLEEKRSKYKNIIWLATN